MFCQSCLFLASPTPPQKTSCSRCSGDQGTPVSWSSKSYAAYVFRFFFFLMFLSEDSSEILKSSRSSSFFLVPRFGPGLAALRSEVPRHPGKTSWSICRRACGVPQEATCQAMIIRRRRRTRRRRNHCLAA